MGAKLDTGVGKKRGVPDVNAEPNVIPFIDVMLVLLIIFMVAAPIATVDIQIDELPTSKTIPSKRPPKPTWVSLQDFGGGDLRVFVMNDQVSFDELGPKTIEAVSINTPDAGGDLREIRDQRIYIRAESRTQYKNVMRVMNRLQDSGFTKIALVAQDTRQ